MCWISADWALSHNHITGNWVQNSTVSVTLPQAMTGVGDKVTTVTKVQYGISYEHIINISSLFC
jgi:hypothetical protein